MDYSVGVELGIYILVILFSNFFNKQMNKISFQIVYLIFLGTHKNAKRWDVDRSSSRKT